jgi:hypothetical protein
LTKVKNASTGENSHNLATLTDTELSSAEKVQLEKKLGWIVATGNISSKSL